ncbi:MAG: patatin-like phospholipase family protein [Ornithinibacter sp.]
MTTAFVLSGGANLGAAQVGMLAAVAEAGVQPDLVVGTSVGALNGAWVAAGAAHENLGAVWRSLRRGSVFPANPLRGLLGFAGRTDHLVSNSGLRRILQDNLTFERLEDAPIPLHVVVTDVLTGAGVLLSSGPAQDSILASASIPGVLPPVSLDGRAYMDGGVVNNSPISHAVELGADTVWVFATGYACALREPPRSALGMALHATTLIVQQRLLLDLVRYAGVIDLRVIPPLCPVAVSPTDFSQADDLIARSYALATAWLGHGPVNPATMLSQAVHPHDVAPQL